MRQSQSVQRYRSLLRPVLRNAQSWNEKQKGISLPEPDVRSPVEKLADIAERIRKEGPCPVSDSLKATRLVRPFTDAAE